MLALINKSITLLGNLNWAEIVNGIVAIWVAIIATLALNTWKQQSKAQKQTEFLDEITESVHEFIYLMGAPIELVKYVKIGIESYAGIHQEDESVQNPEAIAYIKKRGAEDARRLYEYLKPCTQSLSKIRFLVAKGQVFRFKNYAECQNACAVITWQYDRIQALCFVIRDPLTNWKNPKVQEVLTKAIALDPDEIQTQMSEQSVKFLTFVKNNYEAIFR